MKNTIRLISFVLFLLLATGAEIYFGIDAFNESGEAARSTAWPSATGTVDGNRIIHHHHQHSADKYEPVVWYEYEVDSDKYRDNRIGWYEIRYDFREEAQKFLDEHYKEGSPIKVFYDPHHPHHACLITGHATSDTLRGVMHIGAACIFLALAVYLVIKRKTVGNSFERKHNHQDALPTEST